MTSLPSAIRLAVRSLRRQPGFLILVVITLGLTIAAATAVFSLFDAVLLRPFPYDEPERLVRVRTHEPAVPGSTRETSIEDYRDYRAGTSVFESTAQWVTYGNPLNGFGAARFVAVCFTTPSLFDVLRVRPVLGQPFTAADDVLGGDVRRVVISHTLWQQLFNGAPDALGRTVQLRGEAYTVIGVMPAGFRYPDRADVWVPLMARYSSIKDRWWERRDTRLHAMLGRLAPGRTLAQAEQALEGVAMRLSVTYPETNRDMHTRVLTMRDAEVGSVRPYVLLVSAAVAVLLVIGWVNVAGLFVARAAARERELAVCTALGARTSHLLRSLLAESAIVTALGGVLGVTLAQAVVGALTWLIPVELPSWMALAVDARVLVFAVLLTSLTAVVFGLVPLARRRVDLVETLKQADKGGASAGGPLLRRLRRGLIVAEIALSLVLLVSAGLMVRSFAKVMTSDTGVRTDGLIVASIRRFLPNLTAEQQVVSYSREQRRLADAVAALPGVQTVSGGDMAPLIEQPEVRESAAIATRQRATRETAYRGPAQGADVMPGFFGALGIPLLEGRDFTDADDLHAPKVVVISRRAADILFPGRSPIGEEIKWGNNSDYDPWTRVVGVVANTRWQPAEQGDGVEIYWSYLQYPSPNAHLLIRTAGDPQALIPAVRRALQDANPEFAIERVQAMTTVVAESVWERRLWGVMLGTVAALALTLAAIGLYGVLSHVTAQRSREFAIRLAVGAAPASLLTLVVRHGLGLAAAGIALGAIGAVGAGRLMEHLLFGVSAIDVTTFVVVAALLVIVAILASIVPAWRAARTDPLVVMRDQ